MGKRIFNAFLTGGVIGIIGQALIMAAGMIIPDTTAALMLGMLLFAIVSVFVISSGLYLKIAQFGGSGASIPLCGLMFGAAMGAVEARKEGKTAGQAFVKGFLQVAMVVAIGYALAFLIGMFLG